MNRYTETEQAKKDYFEHEMMKHKEKCLKKLIFISSEYDIQYKFAQMLIDAECEECIYAQDFICYFELDELDKFSIVEDLENFTEEFIRENENAYCEVNHE